MHERQRFSNLNMIHIFSGYHENVVGYHSSWFENEQLYIQLELCDHSLSVNKLPKLLTEGEALDAMYQVNNFDPFRCPKGLLMCFFSTMGDVMHISSLMLLVPSHDFYMGDL